jgi:pyruvate,water dikinase
MKRIMSGRRYATVLEITSLALALGLGLMSPACAGTFSTVDPATVSAGTFYSGATLHIRGSIGEGSQVVIRIKGASEHHVFNHRGKIGGFMWGGIEHVTFRHAPTFYGVYTSSDLAATAPPAVRSRLQLGYEPLETQMDVEGTKAAKHLMITYFVQFKETEGLYRIAPGAVHLTDPEGGQRGFDVAVPLSANTPPGDLEVAVFELAGGAVIRQETTTVRLLRVGMPAYLFRVTHENGVLFGLVALFIIVTSGLATDFIACRGDPRRRGPALEAFVDLHRLIAEGLFGVRRRTTSSEAIANLQGKYEHFRALLSLNNELLELLAELEEESSWSTLRHPRVRMGIRALFDGTEDMVQVLNLLTGNRYFDLTNVVAGVRSSVMTYLAKISEQKDPRLTLQLEEISSRTTSLVGGKAGNLARIECDLKMRVPRSFVVTTEAYREFLEVEGLASKVRTVLAPARLDAPDDFRRRCELAQDLVRETRVPPAVVEAISLAYHSSGIPLAEGVAVRSSAAGEDSALSFAGQFETVLNVTESGVAEAWKRVVVSRFSPGAVFYRRAAGLAEVDTPMAVLVQRMVSAQASGVLFTRRPEDPKAAELLITAVRGLGAQASAGIAIADGFVVSRGRPGRILHRRIAHKLVRLAGKPGGGLAELPEAAEQQDAAAITDDAILRLVEAAVAIERYFGSSQDIEWAIGPEGEIFILQARPLRVEKPETARGDLPHDASPLLHGGDPVWLGRAVGPVHVARNAEEEDRTPTGALLVVPQLLPDCVRLLPRVCGVVVERGTVTGHAASILREFRVPSLFGVAGALTTLTSGQVVSLDVASRSVFEGALWPRLRGHLPITLLGRRTTGLPDVLAGKLTKLSGSSFMGTWACQSLHDVIRFAHEMAIQSMFEIGDRLLDSPIGGVKQLDCPSLISMYLVDLGGGLHAEAVSRRSVKPEDISSVPLQGLWRGLSDPEFDRERDITFRSFGSAVGRGLTTAGPREMGAPNYACITDSYLNLNSRQAYHFTIVDAFLSDNQNNNHLSLRMKGGGGALWQRNLRAEFVAEVLRLHHFTVNVAGDLVNGWIRGLDRTMGVEKLTTIGRLLRFSALLDMSITSEAHMKSYVAAFVEVERQRPVRDAGAGFTETRDGETCDDGRAAQRPCLADGAEE